MYRKPVFHLENHAIVGEEARTKNQEPRSKKEEQKQKKKKEEKVEYSKVCLCDSIFEKWKGVFC